ncbi:MAG: C39 family peptidase [Verrucomicrobiota bacterium]
MKFSLPSLLLLAIFAWVPPALAQRQSVPAPESSRTRNIPIDKVFEPTGLWTCTDTLLEKAWKDSGFKWLSSQVKDHGVIRRENRGSDSMKLTAFKGTRSVEEVAFLLKGGTLCEVTLAIWNKGDSRNADITEKDFSEIVDGWTTEMTRLVAPQFEDRGKDKASAAKAERRMWVGKDLLAQLEYSGAREKVRDPSSGRERNGKNFQGEFIRLRLLPKPSSTVGLNTSTGGAASVRRSDLAKSVTREATGDVFIPNIPMVDQGDKGYCAVATAARLFNYYGAPADQHEMAQVVGNRAGGGGSSPDEMEEALKKISGKYKTRYQTLLDLDYSSRKYQSFLAKYNRAAKKLGKRVLDTNNYIYFMGGLDPEVLREVNGTGQPFDRFMRIVRENIDKGVPVMWGLQLGLFPENGQKARQAGGGHMRLIIGYNNEKNEIIFSDSWGAGHEKKRMAAPDASAATMGLYLLQPSS